MDDYFIVAFPLVFVFVFKDARERKLQKHTLWGTELFNLPVRLKEGRGRERRRQRGIQQLQLIQF